jgi:starch synthase
MNVLFLAAEASPFVKVGGLADVAGDLPGALRRLGLDIRLVLPFHRSIRKHSPKLTKLVDVNVPFNGGVQSATLYLAELNGATAYLVDGPLMQISREVYVDPHIDTEKFTFCSLAAMRAFEVLSWRPDIVHAHDWHASPAVIWLTQNRVQESFWQDTATLLTIHNLPYMGSGGVMQTFGIAPVPHPRLPSWGEDLPLPAGIATADSINAVSPAYANEIQTAEFGHGLEGLLSYRSEDLSGVLNGIDITHWNPQTDKSLPVNYSRDSLPLRRRVKSNLLKKIGLRDHATTPLLGMVTRLDHQKGVDVAIEMLTHLADMDWQFILLGTGDPTIEERVKSFANQFRSMCHIRLAFDAKLAREMYAGLDMILLPSRYEPCGLAQMIAMRYGCVPVVSRTGGLKDTVMDYRSNPKGTGFIFNIHDPEDAHATLRAAFDIFQDQRRWRGLQQRGMAKDFSWGNSAREYKALYQQTIARWRSEKEG